jgi:hypothetical protein
MIASVPAKARGQPYSVKAEETLRTIATEEPGNADAYNRMLEAS